MSVKEIIESILDYIVRGGPGSGNFGHEGVPGQVGGSAPSGSSDKPIGQVAHGIDTGRLTRAPFGAQKTSGLHYSDIIAAGRSDNPSYGVHGTEYKLKTTATATKFIDWVRENKELLSSGSSDLQSATTTFLRRVDEDLNSESFVMLSNPEIRGFDDDFEMLKDMMMYVVTQRTINQDEEERGGGKNGSISRSVSITDELMQYVGEQLALNYPSETDPETGVELATAILLDLYMDENEIFAIVTLADGKLYKMPIKVDADNKITSEPLVQVAMEFGETSRTLSITREKSGKVRWFAFPACTAVLNRSGEIDSTSLFDSFVEHANKTGHYPELDFYHMGEKVVLGKADWIARDGVAYCASGYFYDTPEANAAIRAISEEPEFWGLSIAYLPTAQPTTLRTLEGIAIPVYTRGINRFISLLPEKSAASIMTSITKEVTRMNSDMKLAIRKLAGDDEELAKSLEEKIDGINRQSADMISREIPQTEKSSTPGQTLTLQADELDPETLKTVVAAVLSAPELEARIKEIIAASKGEEADAEAPEMKTESKTNEVLGQAVATMDRMAKELESIQTRLTAFETDKAQKQRELENETPAKRAMYRPRAAITPQTMQERSKQRSDLDLAAIAADTISKLESN